MVDNFFEFVLNIVKCWFVYVMIMYGFIGKLRKVKLLVFFFSFNGEIIFGMSEEKGSVF